eukprot:TRINITY_DN3093_c0_g2_i1.p1 TRINITY_DN3093_c0_g2~~TRINITY_DN3093_c0_g2_i1.p1  ORF type:complete len:223 (+),score=69.02 TRINITY_DN3093_c0_g2_i1:244-912(+)
MAVFNFFHKTQQFGWYKQKQWSPEWFLIDGLVRKGNNLFGNEVVMPPIGRMTDKLSVNNVKEAKQVREFYKSSTPYYVLVIGSDKKKGSEEEFVCIYMYPLDQERKVLNDPLSGLPFIRFYKRLAEIRRKAGNQFYKLNEKGEKEFVKLDQKNLPEEIRRVITEEAKRIHKTLMVEILGPFLSLSLLNKEEQRQSADLSDVEKIIGAVKFEGLSADQPSFLG